ncbi:MAG: cupin domain-containing protein [Proteobacteria bacterium]|nr:cupin domain-containing protein [Pseudomonadota bacterium]
MKLNLDIDNFLAEYWQQKPLLIRNAIPDFVAPIDADELAGLAMESEVESRIIETLPDNWGLYHGPFKEADYRRDKPWTLLVQAVDHYVQEVAGLLKLVDFIPNWRVDDVMVSYAVDGGSVGPHYDNYDVFLLQGKGKRHWQLGQMCDSHSALLPHPDLRILDHFNCVDEYTLEPGDILYIPPGIAHWGIAQGECTTFSLGFRAPRINDMLSRWADELLENLDPEQFYSDIGQSAVNLSGEIRGEDFDRAKTQLAAALEQKMGQHWFGELVTEPRYSPEVTEEDIDAGGQLLRETDATVLLQPSAKLAWQQSDTGIAVFANGEYLPVSEAIRPAIIQLCKDRKLSGAGLAQFRASPGGIELLEELLSLGCISIE